MESQKNENFERRGETRRKVDLLINRFLNGFPHLCQVTDISRSGMRIIPFHEPTPSPRFMGLQFQLPGTQEILTASGEAVASDEGEIGIRFTRLPAPSAALLDRFLRE